MVHHKEGQKRHKSTSHSTQMYDSELLELCWHY